MYGCFNSPFYTGYQCQWKSYMKPAQIYSSVYADNQILQTDKGAVRLQDVVFQTN